MKNLFASLRLKSTEVKTFQKYFLYAIGEVFLIVIGILIALQLGNWNEEKKSFIQKKRILNDLRTEVQSNLDGIKYVISQKKNIVQICQFFLKHTGPDTKWELRLNFDSLLVKTIVSGWSFKPETGVLSEVLSSGRLDLIKNDRLRYLISSLPGYTERFQLEDEIVKGDLHNMYLPFLSKSYTIKNTNHFESGDLTEEERKAFASVSQSKFKSSPEALLNNREFENQINVQMLWVNFSLFHYDRQKKNYEQVISMIDDELKMID